MLVRSQYVALLALLISGCISSEEKSSVIGEALQITPVSSPVALSNQGPGCRIERFEQPDAVVTRKVDLLFLTDTSSSLNEERAAIADGIDSFISALPADVDLRVSVMLAHSSRSSWSGKLYHGKGDPASRVLDNQVLPMNTLREKLKVNLTQVAEDSRSDGGEIGMYSLTRALDHGPLTSARAHGFFREDSALVVVFISDEQDICYDYPEGVQPVRDPQGSELEAKERDCVRRAPAEVRDGVTLKPSYLEKISAESVVRKLKDLQEGRPLLTAGIVYNNPATVPNRGGEDEIGYGWIDAVKLTNGVLVDIAGSRYDEGLQNIGSLVSVKLDLKTDFMLTGRDFNVDSLQVKVDGVVTPHAYISEFNQVTLTEAGRARSVIDISYCEKPAPSPSPSPSPSEEPSPEPSPEPSYGVDPICVEGTFARKSVLKLGISNDASEGSITNTVAGFRSLGIEPVLYSDAEVAAGKPAADGVTVLVLSRKIVVTAIDSAYVSGIRSFIQSGGSLLGEYDGAALFFKTYTGIQVSFAPQFSVSLSLANGNGAGGGVLLPLSQSVADIVNPAHPIMEGVSTPIQAGLRTAFAISGYDTEWFDTLATYRSLGSSGSIPAGTFPAVMAARCGQGRVAFYTMNHFGAFSSSSVSRMISNTVQWLIGDR